MNEHEQPLEDNMPSTPVLAQPRIPTVGRPMVIKLKSVMKQTALSRTTIYKRMKEGKFPEQVPLGGRAVGWNEQEVDDWLNAQMATRKSAIKTGTFAH
jgi:prophage regulatory protein